MTDHQSILVATDFSPDARNAVKRTAMICATAGVPRAVALHVLESTWIDTFRHFVSLPMDIEVDRAIEEEALRSLEEQVVAAHVASGYMLEPKMCHGSSVDAILDASEGFGLLVLGARGKHSPQKSGVGPTVERLLRQIQKPVLVVRRKATSAYRRALVAVDFSTHSNTAFSYATAIAPQAEIHLIHALEAPFEAEMLSVGVAGKTIHEYHSKIQQEAEAEMGRFIEKSGADRRNLHVAIEHGAYVPTILRDKAMEIDADLVIVGKHGKSLLERLLMGSVTLHLLTECPCDVLVTQ
jgi:nucleotide-binding universal stress UspA family protein